MHDLAMITLASGGKSGGGRLLVLAALLVVILALAAGWIWCAGRPRDRREKKP